jgi:hypothetical protein
VKTWKERDREKKKKKKRFKWNSKKDRFLFLDKSATRMKEDGREADKLSP